MSIPQFSLRDEIPRNEAYREVRRSEAIRAKEQGIFREAQRNCAVAYHPPSPRLRRGRLSLRFRGKPPGSSAKASDEG
jgi:hypothetical protein